MARFPHYRSNVVALGQLLAHARMDKEKRRKLIQNPKDELRKIGLPEHAVQLMDFAVVDATQAKTTVLPYRLNQKKIDQADPGYLVPLARQFS